MLIFGAEICQVEQTAVKNRPAGQTALKFRHLLPNVYPTQKFITIDPALFGLDLDFLYHLENKCQIPQ